MSDEKRQRQSKNAEHKRALAEMRDHQPAPLPPPPRILERTRAPLEDVPEPRRRTTRYVAPSSTHSAAARPAFDQAPPRPQIIPPAVESRMDLQRVRALSRTSPPPIYVPDPPSPLGFLEELQARPWLVVMIALLSIVAILLTRSPDGTTWSNFLNRSVAQLSATAQPQPSIPALMTPPGEHTVLLQGEPQITAAVVDRVLAEYGSPAAGTGQLWIDLGRQYGIEPAYALAFFIHESSAGTNPSWAGLKPDGTTTHNIGNIICAGYPTCFGRFRDYQGWREGIEDWYRLISVEYIEGRSAHTVEQIIPIYAPSFENNVPAYVQAVVNLINQWRSQGAQP